MAELKSDPRGLPIEAGHIPDYTELADATARFHEAYQAELDCRRREREKRWRRAARERDVSCAAAIRSELLAALGTFEPADVPEPRLLWAGQLSSDSGPAAARQYLLEGAARPVPMGPDVGRPQDIGLLELEPRQEANGQAILVLGDATSQLLGCQSPASLADGLGRRFASAGYRVFIPDLPSMRDLSATRTKALLVQGSCALGEIVDEAERALRSVCRLAEVDTGCVWVAGRGLGGLAAILLAALLDGRLLGCVSIDAPRVADVDCDETLTIPFIHLACDMADAAAATAPSALALVEAGQSAWGPCDFSLAWVDARARAARRAAGLPPTSYLRQKGLASPADFEQLLAWMAKRSRQGNSTGRGAKLAMPRRRQRVRRFAVGEVKSLRTWQRQRGELRKTFFELLGIPRSHAPHRVVAIAADELNDCRREELDVYSSPHTGAKVLILTPHRPRVADGPNAVVLCLPGSSSHAGQVERAYAHEVVARGWTAVVPDCRARIYRGIEGARRGRVVVAQSILDLLCVMDYLVGREDIDPARIGTMGLSQGGFHSWMLAALDERIAAAAPVCGLSTYATTIADIRDDAYDGSYLSFLDSHSFYVYIPHLLQHADVGDLMGLIAPRPLAILGGRRDHVFPTRGVRRIHRELKGLYQLYGSADRLSCTLIDARHSMPPRLRQAAYRFFDRHL